VTALLSESISDSLAATLRRSAALEAAIERDAAPFRILTGDRPTGPLHVGHYFGTVANRVRLQDLGAEVFVLIADYQVLTDRDTAEHLREYVTGLVLDYLACGIDPGRSEIFAHSAVPALNQLLLPFLSLVSVPELQRNPTVKDEVAHSRQSSVSGLMFSYRCTRRRTSCSARRRWSRSGRTSCRTSRSPGWSRAGSMSDTGPSSRCRRRCCRTCRSCSAPTAAR
jgi:hypothetical protein